MALIDGWEKGTKIRKDEVLQIHETGKEEKKQRQDVIVQRQNEVQVIHNEALEDKKQRQADNDETKKKNKAAHEKALADKKQRQDEKDERRSYVWGYKAGIETKQTSSNDSYQQIA